MKIKPKLFVALLFALLFAKGSFAEYMPEKVLRWGASLEGGAPYVLHDPFDQTKLTGFETEVAEALAKELGLESEVVQSVWDILIPGLNRNLFDVTLDGIEITPEHTETVNVSIPYYITYMQFVVPKGNPANISSLETARGHSVGVIRGALTYNTLIKAGVVDVRAYDTEAEAFQDMENGRLDSVFFDAPDTIYYASFNPLFEFVGEPVGHVEYGVFVRKGEDEFLKRINEALVRLRDNDTLRRIYDRWNLWSPVMAEYFNDYRPALEKPVMYERWADYQRGTRNWSTRIKRYISYMPSFGEAAVVTLSISICAMVLAVAVGLVLVICRMFGPAPLRWLIKCYIELVRGTPVMIQLFFIFYGLPNLGIEISPFIAGTLGLGMNYAVYESENYRMGLLAVPRAQMEGALALGMTKWQALRYVVLPQAFRITLLPMTNDFVAMLKDSSLVSIITLIELTRAYGLLASVNYDYFATGIIVAIIYLLIGWPFVRLSRYLERSLNVSLRGRKLVAVHRAANINE